MAVKSWNDHIEVVTEGGVTYAKAHEEFTVKTRSELADIDTTCLLQGSIVWIIDEHVPVMWDETDWIDQQ